MRRFKPVTSALTLAVGGMLALTGPIGPARSQMLDSRHLRQGLPDRRVTGGSRSFSMPCLTPLNQPTIELEPVNNIDYAFFEQGGENVYLKKVRIFEKVVVTDLSFPETTAFLKADQECRYGLSPVSNL